jgi:hypothetical protein
MLMFWLALIISLVLAVSTAIYATLKGLEAFRGVKRLGRVVGSELDQIERATGEIERQLALAAEGGTRLGVSLARLSASRARLNVLTSALSDVRAAVGRITAVVPRK